MATVDAADVANPPAYMVAAIGEPSYLDSPSAIAFTEVWCRAAERIERMRLQLRVTDTDYALVVPKADSDNGLSVSWRNCLNELYELQRTITTAREQLENPGRGVE